MSHAKMLARTPLSATETHHYSHGLHSVWLKVYFQDLAGRIRAVSGNDGGASEVAVDKANLNNQFAAVSWGGPETGVAQEERLYYTEPSGRIFEHKWTSSTGWQPGDLTGQYSAAPYSALAAATYSFNSGRHHHIQLYFQDAHTNEVREVFKNGDAPWAEGVRHPAGMPSTSIAVASTGEGTQVWYQTPDTRIVQWWFEAGQPWRKGNFVSDLVYDPGAAIACASRYRVFTVTHDNKLALTVYANGRWERSKLLIDQVPYAAAAGIAHPKHHSNAFVATVFGQKNAGEITKVQFREDNTWEESTLEIKL